MKPPNSLITPDRFDAVLFDLDGVLTQTAKLHASCWKRMFDDFLRGWSASHGQPFEPFEIESDYKKYIDGRLRYDGVRTFLESRGIHLSEGKSDDPPETLTVRGLGNRKNKMLSDLLTEVGVETYEGSVAWLRQLRDRGFQTAVVSASRNCEAIVKTAGLVKLFDVRVDGRVAEQMQLAGKPAPDTFLAAAHHLGVEPKRAVVVEDAISGVQAGHSGGFGLVIGVNRKGDAKSLEENGAHIVVNDLSELLL